MQYVYPCLITQLFSDTTPTAGYVATLPDFENQMVYGDNMFSVISEAQRALAIKLYYAETESNNIPEPSEYKTFELESNQYLSFILCDTENFAMIFDLYEQLKTEDLITYLQDKNEILEKDILPKVSMTPLKRKSNKNAKIENQINVDIDFDVMMDSEIQNDNNKTKENKTKQKNDNPNNSEKHSELESESESKSESEIKSVLNTEYKSESKSSITAEQKTNESGLIAGFKTKKKHKKHKDKQNKTEIKEDVSVKPELNKTDDVPIKSVDTKNNKNTESEKQNSVTKETKTESEKNNEAQIKTSDVSQRPVPVNQARREPPKKYLGDKKKDEKKASDKISEANPTEPIKKNSLNLNKQEKTNSNSSTSTISDQTTNVSQKPNARPGVTLQRPRQGNKKS